MHADPNADTVEYVPVGTLAGLQPPNPLSTRVRVDLAARSDRGRVRPNNEDRYLVVRAGRFLQPLLTNLEEGCVPGEFGDAIYLMAVADGMGGAAGGEVASRLALTTVLNMVLNTPDWIFAYGEPQVVELVERTTRRFQGANAALLEEASRDPGLRGMGTTLTGAWSLGDTLFVAHVGDSRAYLFRRGRLHRLTRDHTLAQELVDAGVIQPHEVATNQVRHVLTRVLGAPGAGPEPEVQRVRLADGDRLLLCTDGLTDRVEEAAIAAELGRADTADAACQALVERALDRGGRDNITVVVAGYAIPREP